MARPAHLPVWKFIFQRTLTFAFLSHLFHLTEDPQQVSTKDAPKLFLPPASPQQLLYEYRVCGHILQPLGEPAWPPAG